MANQALFVGWNRVVAGREAAAMALFQESLGWYAQQQQAGHIESFEPVLLEPHGGDLGGFVLIRGDQHQIDRLRRNEEFRNIVLRANFLIEGVGVINADINESIANSMAVYQSIISK